MSDIESPLLDVIIVGAGLAGLACANEVHQRGLRFKLIEQSDAVGGRIQTDNVDGFLLDRGFQVLLTAYPEAKKILDMKALQLRHFNPGAMVRYNNHFYRVDDPLRSPLQALPTVLSPIGSLWDKLNILPLRSRVTTASLETLMRQPETTTLKALTQAGFSADIIEPFFRPFLGGIFLDAELNTSSRMFDFVFRMFSQGNAALPKAGMQAIPQQLAAKLPAACITLNTNVIAVTPNSATLMNGEIITARAVVVATEAPSAAKLIPTLSIPPSRHVGCFYYAAKETPINAPILVLNGAGSGIVNNLCVPSLISRQYAPPNQHLISVSVLNVDVSQNLDALSDVILTELTAWFGPVVKSWKPLRHYAIQHALPAFEANHYTLESRPVKLAEGLYVCGDYRENPSINGALASGRKVSEAILASLS